MTRTDPTKPIRSGCLTSEEPPLLPASGAWEALGRVYSPGLPRVPSLGADSVGAIRPACRDREEGDHGNIVRALRAGQASCPRDFAGRKLGPEERFLVS